MLKCHYCKLIYEPRRNFTRSQVVTPHVTNSVIMAISVLIMHQLHQVIHFEANQRNSNQFQFKSVKES
jgi:hypothetical protein